MALGSLGKIMIDFGADVSDATKGIGDLQKRLDDFSSGTKQTNEVLDELQERLLKAFTLGAAIAGVEELVHTLVDWTVEAAETTKVMDNLAMRTGMATSTVEGMQVAMARVGLDTGTFAMSMQQLSKHLVEAQNESSASANAFDTMGISLQTLGGSNLAAVFAMAEAFKTMPDGAEKTALAMELMGRGGAQMIPILNKGAAGLVEAQQKAELFGLVLTDVQRGALEAFDEKVDDMGKAMQGFKTAVAIYLVPSASTIVEALTRAIVTSTQFWHLMADDTQAEKTKSTWDKVKDAINVVVNPLAALMLKLSEAKTKLAEMEAIANQTNQTQMAGANQPGDAFLARQETQQAKGTAIVTKLIGDWQRYEAALEHAQVSWEIDSTQRVADMKVQDDMLGKLVAHQEAMQALEEHADQAKKPMDSFMGQKLDFSPSAPPLTSPGEIGDPRGGGQLENIRAGNAALQEGLEIEKERATQAATTIENLNNMATLSTDLAGIESARYQADKSFFRDSTLARQTALKAIEDQRDAELASATEQMASETKLESIRDKATAKMIAVAGQFPDFWDTAMQQVNQASTYAFGQIMSSFSQTMASMILNGGTMVQFFKSAAQILLSSLIQTALQMGLNWVLMEAKKTSASEAANAAQVTGHTAMETAKTAATTTGEGARLVLMAATNKAMMAGVMATIAAVGTVGNLALAAMEVVLTAVASVLYAMASAVGSVPIIGQAMAGAFIVGATLTEVLGSAAMVAGTAALETALGAAIVASTTALATPFAVGGIVTQPTFAMIGEAGPEAVVPLDQLNVGGKGAQTIIVELDGRQITKYVSDDLVSYLRLRGVPA